MDAILLLMQVGRDGDWTDRGLPEVVTGSRARDARAAGVQWLLDHHPSAPGNDWRLLVWAHVRDKPWSRDTPSAIITPSEYRMAAGRQRDGKSFTIRHPPLRAERDALFTHKIEACELQLGDRILLTQEQANTTAPLLPGPWYPAHEPGDDTIAARVLGFSTMRWRGKDVITLHTHLGFLPQLPANQSVIPVEES